MLRSFLELLLTLMFLPSESQADVHQVEQESYLCYGSSENDFTKGKCDSSKKILIKDFLLGSKPDDMNCPQEMFGVPNETEYLRCCSPNSRDCSERLVHLMQQTTHYDTFYSACMGKTQCTPRPTVRAPTNLTSCKENTTYLPYTNYMYFNFSCIPDSLIGRLTKPLTLHTNGPGKALYLQKRDYDKFDSKSSSGTCSIAVDCESYINITQLHINFTSTAAGVCLENLAFSENGTKFLYLDCKDNSQHNKYMQKVIGVSVGNFIQMIYRTESLDVGHFWIGFTSSSNGNLQIKCPADKQDCSKFNRSLSNGKSGIQSISTTTTIGIALGALLLILITIAICCKKERSKKIHPQPDTLQKHTRNSTSAESTKNETDNPTVNNDHDGGIKNSDNVHNSHEQRESTVKSIITEKQKNITYSYRGPSAKEIPTNNLLANMFSIQQINSQKDQDKTLGQKHGLEIYNNVKSNSILPNDGRNQMTKEEINARIEDENNRNSGSEERHKLENEYGVMEHRDINNDKCKVTVVSGAWSEDILQKKKKKRKKKKEHKKKRKMLENQELSDQGIDHNYEYQN